MKRKTTETKRNCLAMVFALIDQVEDGQMEAGAAIEAIEDLTW